MSREAHAAMGAPAPARAEGDCSGRLACVNLASGGRDESQKRPFERAEQSARARSLTSAVDHEYQADAADAARDDEQASAR